MSARYPTLSYDELDRTVQTFDNGRILIAGKEVQASHTSASPPKPPTKGNATSRKPRTEQRAAESTAASKATLNHDFTVIWVDKKLPENFARYFIACSYRGESGKSCSFSWAEHGKPAVRFWTWHRLPDLEKQMAIDRKTELAWGKWRAWWTVRLRRIDANATARDALAVIASYADKNGYAWPSEETLAYILGVHKRTVIRAINQLVAAGILTIIPPKNRRKGDCNTYRLNFTKTPIPID
ncbi:MAG: helix-turn-helix domain-containing protein [Candidatus Cybelea sp.]